MYRLRSFLIPALVPAGFLAAFFCRVSTVQAGGKPDSTSVARTIFPSPNLLRYESLALLPAVAEGENAGQADTPLPPGKGRDLALKYCVTCHGVNVWATQHHRLDQWNTVLDNMVSKGLDASDEDLATISAYLANNFGPVKKDQPAAPPPSSPGDTPPPPSSRE